MQKRVLVTGSTGFIGRALCEKLRARKYRVIALVREFPEEKKFPADEFLRWGGNEAPSDIDMVVHLAGESIAGGRWSPARKKKIQDSRVGTARKLSGILQKITGRSPSVMISASAIGFYGDRGEELLREDSAAGSGFLAETCVMWERAAKEMGIPRTVLLRSGIVLGRGGGALEKMLPPFRAGLGGRLGSGEQWMSWIHLQDLVELCLFALETSSINGPLNGVAPQPVKNSVFTKALGSALGRPTILPVPAFALKIALGEMSQLLLESQRVQESVTGRGFQFRFPGIDSALVDSVK